MHITQDEAERLIRLICSYQELTRILLDRPASLRGCGTLAEIETELAFDRVQLHGGRKREAAKSLGISHQTLERYLQRPSAPLVEEALAG